MQRPRLPHALRRIAPWVLGACVVWSATPTSEARAQGVGRVAVARAGAFVSAAAGMESSAEADKKKSDRVWVTHRVIAGETLNSIADRYNVSVKALKRWNKKRMPSSGYLIAYRTKLKIYARNPPPPREEVTYIVKKGDTYAKIAKKHQVPTDHLRRWNKKKKRLRAGDVLKVWTDPREPPPPPVPVPAVGSDEPLPSFAVRQGGYAVGKPNRGRLVGGVIMPPSDMYVLRNPDTSYGTTHAVQVILTAIATFKRNTGYEAPLEMGSLSRKNGGRFRPHSSHQTGRDVDIRLPKRDGVPLKKVPTIDEVDWVATWRLIEAFVETGQIEYIFLSYRRQRYLYKAAQRVGASQKDLERLIQYPRGSRHRRAMVRHAEGHDIHIHIRIRCAAGNERCITY